MRIVAVRREGGQPLREVMKAKAYSNTMLAAETAAKDPDGRGISHQLIAALATDREWARESCSPASAKLIAAALDLPAGTLFEMPVSLFFYPRILHYVELVSTL